MTAGRIIAKSEWRLRWRVLVVIGVIAWLAASVAIAALSASRRAGTSFDRLLEATGTANAEGFYEGPPDAAFGERFRQLSKVDGVEGGAAASMFIVGPAEGDLVAGGNVIGAALRHSFGNSLNGLIVDGRFPDQTKVDEIFVNEAFRDVTGYNAGDRIDLVSYTLEEVERVEQTGEFPDVPGGPTVPVRITGVGRGAEDVSDVGDPIIILTAAFADRYQDEIGNLSTMVLLRVDPDRFEEVAAAADEVFPEGVGLERAEDFGARLQEGIGVQRIALLVFAGVASAAGLLAAGQNVRRFVALTARQRQTLQALGASRRLDLHVVGVTIAPVAVAVALLSAPTSVLVAPLLVTGLAEQAEPDPGPWFDPAVQLGGAAAVLAAMLAFGVACAMWGRGAVKDERASLADGVARRLRLPASTAIGVRFALDAGRHAGGVPTRSAIAGASVGVAGAVATLTFSASIAGLFDRPSDWGARYDLNAFTAADRLDTVMDTAEDLSAVDGVGAVAVNVYAETDEVRSVLRAGSRQVSQEFEASLPVAGVVPLTIREGREPASPSDLVVGARVLDDLDVGVGDRVTAIWGDREVERTIVGVVVSPGIDEVDRAAYMSRSGLEELSDDLRAGVILVGAEEGTAPDALAERLRTEFDLDVGPVEAPSSVDNLDELGSLPSALVGFLAVLSLVAGASAMILTIRRRKTEIAVLRSLGFIRSQVVSAIAAQSTTLAVLALVVGMPVGLVAGRAVYALVGSNIGVLVNPTMPVAPLVAVTVAALAAAGLAATAVLPGALRAATAATLRAE